ncbi:MAG: hypothetical protein HYZ28_10855 [Myxococcales bacterium]|nr:hypothetical protein [Myxococcales bacterium]
MPTAMLLSVLLAGSASPTAVVLVTRRVSVSAAEGASLADQLGESLRLGGLAFVLSSAEAAARLESKGNFPPGCDKNPSCLAHAGESLEASVAVGVELARLGDQLAVHLQAVRTRDASLLEEVTFVSAEAKAGEKLHQQGRILAGKLRSALAPPDAPTAVRLEPGPEEPPALPRAPGRPPSAAVYGTGAAAIALSLAAGALALSGNASRGRLQGALDVSATPPRYSISESEALALQRAAQRDYTLAAACGLASAALAITAGFLAASPPSERP